MKYTRRYLRARGWTLRAPIMRLEIEVIAHKKPYSLSLHVPEKGTTQWRSFVFDATARISAMKMRIGVLTQDLIDDDLRMWADHYAIPMMNPSDLPRVEQIMRHIQKRRLIIEEQASLPLPVTDVQAVRPQDNTGPGEGSMPQIHSRIENSMDAVPDAVRGDARRTLAPPASAAGAKPDRRAALAALRDAKSPASLGAALDGARELFAGRAWPLREALAWANRNNDWALAAKFARLLMDSHPDIVEGYRLGVRAARALGDDGAADALAWRAADIFPSDAWPLAEMAQAAQSRRDWVYALEVAGTLRARFPAEQTGYRVGAFCLIQMKQFAASEALLRDAEKFGAQAWALAYARAARVRADWQAARQRWAAFRAAFPDHPEGFVEGAIADRNLADFDAADELLARAMQLFPRHAGVLEQYARVAQSRPDWPEASRRWDHVRDACPDDAAIALGHAELPARGLFGGARGWDEAFARFDSLHAQFPDLSEGYSSHIGFLCSAKRYGIARKIAATSLQLFPQDRGIALAHAAISERVGDLSEAAAHYERICASFPACHVAPTRLANVLARQGHAKEADAVCESAIAQFPTQPDVFREYAELAMLRHEWATARARLEDAASRFPYERRIRLRLHQAQLADAQSADVVERLPASAVNTDQPPPRSGALPSLADMATRFESLGGTLQGCEFGPVQRGFGAEPLGLLRWSSARLSGLVDCLNEDFAGVGTPEQTIVAFASARNSIKEGNGDPEYITRDRRFRFSGHTFIKKSQIPPDKMFKQSCRRITFLKRKMMEDLAEGSKVFVFKLGDRVLSDDEIDLLYHALRRYGNNTLLYVRHHDADHPSGTAELVKDGLILGYIDQFSMGEDNMPRQPNLPAWSAICERAWRLRFMSADAVSGFDVSAG